MYLHVIYAYKFIKHVFSFCILNSKSFDRIKVGLMVQLVLHNLLLVNFFLSFYKKIGNEL